MRRLMKFFSLTILLFMLLSTHSLNAGGGGGGGPGANWVQAFAGLEKGNTTSQWVAKEPNRAKAIILMSILDNVNNKIYFGELNDEQKKIARQLWDDNARNLFEGY